MGYPCPYKGTEKGVKQCNRDAETLRGWKKHMTRQHGQYSEEQLRAVTGAAPMDAERGRDLFLAEADEVPGLEASTGETTGEMQDNPPREGTTRQAPEQPTIKRVPLKLKKIRKFMASFPDMILKAGNIETDEGDKELMDFASEITEEFFGIAFEFPEEMWVIRSRWVAICIPFFAVAVVWFKHTLGARFAAMKEEKETQATGTCPKP